LVFFNSETWWGRTASESAGKPGGSVGSEVSKKEEAHEGVGPRWKGNRKLADTVDSVSEALEAHFGGMASLLAPASGGSY